MPDAERVVAYLGRTGDATALALAGEHLPVVAAMVHAYTRGRGFDPLNGEPGEDVAAVIVSATARLLGNPEHNVSLDLKDFSIRPGTFAGWTLPELAILHRYRRRAM